MPEPGPGASSSVSSTNPSSGTDYRAILNAIHDGFHIIELLYDPAGTPSDYRYLEANQTFEQHTGIPYPVGRLGSEVTPGTEAHWFTAYDAVVQSGQALHFEEYNAFTGRWYDTYASRVGERDAHQVAVVFSDITDRKRVEQAVRISEERLRLFVTATSDSVYRMSADWQEMYALDGKNVLADTTDPSSSWLDVYIPDSEQAAVWVAIDDAIRRKAPFELEHRVIQADGTVGWTSSRAIPLLNEQNAIVEWFGTASDITERKRTEATVQALNQALERQIQQHTSDLKQANAALSQARHEVEALSARPAQVQATGRATPDVFTQVVHADGMLGGTILTTQERALQDRALRLLQSQPPFRARFPKAELRGVLSHRDLEDASQSQVCLVFSLPGQDAVAFWAKWGVRDGVSFATSRITAKGP